MEVQGSAGTRGPVPSDESCREQITLLARGGKKHEDIVKELRW